MESLDGEDVWVSPLPKGLKNESAPLRVTVWFEKQLLGDGAGYQRRAAEFKNEGRMALREAVMAALKEQSNESFKKAQGKLNRLSRSGTISGLERHWIVNGFSCVMRFEDVSELEEVPGVRKVFLRPNSSSRRTELPREGEEVSVIEALEKPSFENVPWYIKKLKADQVWKDFGVTGKGTLNVIHDKNFIISDHLARNVYRNPSEIPDNGKDDDGNGYVDDYFGYNFDRQSNALYTASFSGEAKDRKVLHGTSCANIVSGSGDEQGSMQCGVAPLSQCCLLYTSDAADE